MKFRSTLLIIALVLGLIGRANAQGFSTMFVQPSGSTPIPAMADALGRLIVDTSGAAVSTLFYKSSALEGSKVVSAAPAILSGLMVTNSTVSLYLMVWNSTTVPADGAVSPDLCMYIPSSPSTNGYALNFKGAAGVSIAVSTTGCFTKTVSATAMFMAWYILL